MPFLAATDVAGKKRKRPANGSEKSRSIKSTKAANSAPKQSSGRQDEILGLEKRINESRKHYNDIAALITVAGAQNEEFGVKSLAAVALCRVFCRLVAEGNLEACKNTTESELVIVQWLRDRQNDYVDVLCGFLESEEEELQTTAMTLAMRLAGEEVKRRDNAWNTGVFPKVFPAILRTEAAVSEYATKYFTKYDDIRFQSLQSIPCVLAELRSSPDIEQYISNTLDLLFELEVPPSSDNEIQSFFGARPERKHSMLSVNGHKRVAQDAWLSVLQSHLSSEQRKGVLTNLVGIVVPWFEKVERLADFLTDSYDQGGSTSLLALSGVFQLMQEKNLDYPAFYRKLYSLLDEGLLHSKHRSRFFRLLDTFMSSTHLPAQLVASFIKRLARLALHAPPAGIVVVIPWIYNMFKKHPQCTFMIHREPTSDAERRDWQKNGAEEPFDMDEPDPMRTGAIDSSLWEVETLQSHYHPNVATLAKIISEQFTKQAYNMEDFLDHSYNSLLDAELGRNLKKAPVVEYQIPRRIFTEDGAGLNRFGTLINSVMEAT